MRNESETRAELIDPLLMEAGWGKVEGSRIRREYRITPGRLQGHGKRGEGSTADYVLVYRNTKLAVLEAKAEGKPLTEGLGQAKRDAFKISVRFAYSSNGKGLYEVDRVTGVEGEVEKYPTPEELWDRTFPSDNAWRDRLADVPFEDKSGFFQARYYQDTAIDKATEAIANGRDRILLTLATGTGKTFIAFQIAWKLFKARWNLSREPNRLPRILFLADRNILADQAFNSFNAFGDDAMERIAPDSIRKKGLVPKSRSIYFTIFQTFMSGPPTASGDSSPYFGEYPPDFFDLIIVDECHRGGANDESSWRAILEYFSPAVQLGLTATPKRTGNVDTYAYFGEPVYVYSLKEGINDGFLTPFRVKQISTTLDEYMYTADDRVMEGDVEKGKLYTEGDFNQTIEIQERERKRVQIFLGDTNPREKTLVFCATQEHALVVRDLINQLKSVNDPDYCHRVTADDGALGEQHLRNFQDNEKTIPTILTTSRKLSTGVDARNIRNIVLMREVKSMLEFKQIIGRGTRLFEGKDYFTVYDFVKAHYHFADPEWDGEPIGPIIEPDDDDQPDPPEPDDDEEKEFKPRPPKVRVKLADGKERTIAHMMSTTFWHPDGRPMTAQQFLEALFGKLPDFFKNEAELRTLWSLPDTRKKLLQNLAESGFGIAQLTEMQRILEAEHSDLFDVLTYVAYTSPPISREERAARAKIEISAHFNSKQQIFLDFVLSHYVKMGVGELDQEKLTPLLHLKYRNSIADAIKDLGPAPEIRHTFSEFQRFLYQDDSVA